MNVLDPTLPRPRLTSFRVGDVVDGIDKSTAARQGYRTQWLYGYVYVVSSLQDVLERFDG